MHIPSEPFPTLNADRLTLRELTMHDKEPIYALRSNSQVNKYLGRKTCEHIDEAVQFISRIHENYKNGTSLYWVITLKDSGEFVGTISLFNFSSTTNSCEMGYELLPAYQQQGIMKEAAILVINYVLHTLNYIHAASHRDNIASNALLLKLNFIKLAEVFEDNTPLIQFKLSL
jgi:[ribosomal protein S5]-alanine N-acetyltransferase